MLTDSGSVVKYCWYTLSIPTDKMNTNCGSCGTLGPTFSDDILNIELSNIIKLIQNADSKPPKNVITLNAVCHRYMLSQ